MEHILSGHTKGGSRVGPGSAKDLFPENMTAEQIEREIQVWTKTREAANRATGNKATAYFNKDGSYVVRDNITGDIIQISNRYDLNWVPDATIKNPYLP